MALTHRTPFQETRYTIALGYAWGRKDADPHDRATLILSSTDFAVYYAMLKDVAQFDWSQTFNYFSALSLDEQEAYGTVWARLPHASS